MTRNRKRDLIRTYWACPGCGYMITDLCYDQVRFALNCTGCGKHTTDDFIELPDTEIRTKFEKT